MSLAAVAEGLKKLPSWGLLQRISSTHEFLTREQLLGLACHQDLPNGILGYE